jgi:hypothetical protein
VIAGPLFSRPGFGDVLRTNELQAWFVAEHVVETPAVRAGSPGE